LNTTASTVATKTFNWAGLKLFPQVLKRNAKETYRFQPAESYNRNWKYQKHVTNLMVSLLSTLKRVVSSRNPLFGDLTGATL